MIVDNILARTSRGLLLVGWSLLGCVIAFQSSDAQAQRRFFQRMWQQQQRSAGPPSQQQQFQQQQQQLQQQATQPQIRQQDFANPPNELSNQNVESVPGVSRADLAIISRRRPNYVSRSPQGTLVEVFQLPGRVVYRERGTNEARYSPGQNFGNQYNNRQAYNQQQPAFNQPGAFGGSNQRLANQQLGNQQFANPNQSGGGQPQSIVVRRPSTNNQVQTVSGIQSLDVPLADADSPKPIPGITAPSNVSTDSERLPPSILAKSPAAQVNNSVPEIPLADEDVPSILRKPDDSALAEAPDVPELDEAESDDVSELLSDSGPLADTESIDLSDNLGELNDPQDSSSLGADFDETVSALGAADDATQSNELTSIISPPENEVLDNDLSNDDLLDTDLRSDVVQDELQQEIVDAEPQENSTNIFEPGDADEEILIQVPEPSVSQGPEHDLTEVDEGEVIVNVPEPPPTVPAAPRGSAKDAAEQALEELVGPQGENAADTVSVKEDARRERLSLRFVNLGDEKFGEGEYDQAFKLYQTASDFNPDSATAQQRQAMCWVATAKFKQAASAMKLAVDLDSEWPQSGFKIADLYGADNLAAKKSHVDALARETLANRTDSDFMFLLGVVSFFDGQQDRADIFLRRAAELSGDDDGHVKKFLTPAAQTGVEL